MPISERAKQLKQKKARDARAEKAKSNLPDPTENKITETRDQAGPKFKRDPKRSKRIKPERTYEVPKGDDTERQATPGRGQRDPTLLLPRPDDAKLLLDALPGFIQTETEIEI